MKFFVCTIRDIGSHEYKSLTLEPTEYSALRSFESSVVSSCASKQGLLWSHPEDFELHVIAEFDSVSGELKPVTRYLLCDALDVFPDKSQASEIRKRILEERGDFDG